MGSLIHNSLPRDVTQSACNGEPTLECARHCVEQKYTKCNKIKAYDVFQGKGKPCRSFSRLFSDLIEDIAFTPFTSFGMLSLDVCYQN